MVQTIAKKGNIDNLALTAEKLCYHCVQTSTPSKHGFVLHPRCNTRTSANVQYKCIANGSSTCFAKGALMKKLSAVLAPACAATVFVLSLCLPALWFSSTSTTAYAATEVCTNADAAENSETICQAQIDGLSLAATESLSSQLSIASIDGKETTSTEEAICNKIYAAYDTVSESVDFYEDNITYSDLMVALSIVIGNPEYYWAGTSFSYGYIDSDGDGKLSTTDQIVSLGLSYVVDVNEVPQVKKSTEAAIAYALSWVDINTASDFEITQALHDYLVRTCSYNTEIAEGNDALSPAYTAYGALVEGSAVCQGYALAYKLLLSRAGIPAAFVVSYDMGHAWNMVKIDGSWYHVDTTWDDPIPDQGFSAEVLHNCFLRSDASFVSFGYSNWISAYTTPTSDYANKNYKEYKGPEGHTHKLTKTNEVPATCTQAGMRAYWTCNLCNNLFSNANGTAKITTPESIPALGHNFPESGGTCVRCGNATTLLKEVTDTGYFRVTYTPESAVKKGCVTFNGKPMAYDKSAGTWSIVVESAPTESTIDAFAVDEDATAFVLPSFGEERYGDVNNNSKTNIADALITYDLANERYTFENSPTYSYLLADVNTDGCIDSQDAFAIQYSIHYGWTKGAAVN